MDNAIESNGVTIVRTPTGIGVAFGRPFYPPTPNKSVKVEVDYAGRRLQDVSLQTYGTPAWRDYFGVRCDHLKCVIRVKDGNSVVAELGLPLEEQILSFMTRDGDQRHVTESYVSVPPALTITDEVGAVWTIGFVRACKLQSPDGEFAFNVLRDGVDTKEVASRIERRDGKTRIFTRHGWKRWSGQSFV